MKLAAGSERDFRQNRMMNVASGTGLGDVDLHVAAEVVEEAEEAFGGEAVEAAVEERGDLGLGDAEDFAGGALGEAAVLDDAEDACGEFGLSEVFLGMVDAEIGEDVAGTVVDGDFSRHGH